MNHTVVFGALVARPTRETDTSSCTDPGCPICHGAAGHGGNGSGK